MCIRDSLKGITRSMQQVSDSPDVIRIELSPVCCVFDLLTCLLYTSDAADERSSVDLGGRRIIKKKKRDACRDRSVSTSKHVV